MYFTHYCVFVQAACTVHNHLLLCKNTETLDQSQSPRMCKHTRPVKMIVIVNLLQL